MTQPGRSIGEPPPAYDEAIGNPFAPSNDWDKDDNSTAPSSYYPSAPPFLPPPPPMQYNRIITGPCPDYYSGGGSSPLLTHQPLPGELIAGNGSMFANGTSSSGYTPQPTNMLCLHCHSQIVTQTVARAGLLTWLACGGLALIGCWLCCPLPFCISSCQDIEHYCPHCKRFLGTFRRL